MAELRDFEKDPVTKEERDLVALRIIGNRGGEVFYTHAFRSELLDAIVRAEADRDWHYNEEVRAKNAEREWKARYESEREIKRQVMDARDEIVEQRNEAQKALAGADQVITAAEGVIGALREGLPSEEQVKLVRAFLGNVVLLEMAKVSPRLEAALDALCVFAEAGSELKGLASIG